MSRTPRMDLHEALYTTRAMRRVRPDPVPADVQRRMLDAAIRAPSGGNQQNWRFLLVDSPDVRARLAPLYQDAMAQLYATIYKDAIAEAERTGDRRALAVFRSAQWLADNFASVPLLLFGFAQHDPTGGSIFPAVWNAQLAARAEGVGSSLTVVLGIFHPEESNAILGVPPGEGWVQSCCATFGYPLGRWDVAPRRPAHEVSHRNAWGEPVGFEIDEPLWRP
ncbi:nitroreductase family protein [Actinomadura parmotrematis]|uniref:Nitroreductase family protein n=1 Tax=Actinomadura parmotrematis TaxID=2864039 RepID=A0ABS7FWD0_9ACTN|nr:nitroreductase family protein [Actinomadura parmotrematis]MBW8483984.1 nitroreductase family protein [Actinomadura parmotrematis]